MPNYRITMGIPEDATASLILFVALLDDPNSRAGARYDPESDGPHLVRAQAPSGDIWYGELDVDEDAPARCAIDWGAGFTDYSAKLDIFAARVRVGRHVEVRNLVWEGDKHRFVIERIDRI